MGDFIREYGRIAGFFAAAAFVLSLCIGLLSRNPFAAAFLRALLLAVMFAGLGAGLKAAIQRWLPELAGPRAAGAASDAEAGTGRAVDIVLPGEAYAGASAGEPGDEADEPLEAADEAAEVADEPEELSGETEEVSAGPDAAGSPEGASEEEAPLESLDAVEEETQPSAGAAASRRSPPPGPDSPGPEEELPTQALTRAGRDALPDLTDLGSPGQSAQPASPGSYRPAPETHPGRAPSRPSRRAPTPDDAMRGALGSEDPESLAKAIRTVLKRDEG